jgi:hypothetical protein
MDYSVLLGIHYSDREHDPVLVTPSKEKIEGKHASKEISVFNSDSGGVRGVNSDGSVANCIYYMGIIDILQQYDATKRIETIYKSFRVDVVNWIYFACQIDSHFYF